MDIVTHAIIGAIIAELVLWNADYKKRVRGRIVGAIIAASPDLGALPAQFVFSWENGDWPWVYDPFHWTSKENSYWMFPYWLTHSLLITGIFWVFLYKRGWEMWPLLAWASHGFFDVFSHTGGWAIWVIYPLPGQIEGFGDPWSWHPSWWVVSAMFGFVVWYMISLVTDSWRANTLVPGRA